MNETQKCAVVGTSLQLMYTYTCTVLPCKVLCTYKVCTSKKAKIYTKRSIVHIITRK